MIFSLSTIKDSDKFKISYRYKGYEIIKTAFSFNTPVDSYYLMWIFNISIRGKIIVKSGRIIFNEYETKIIWPEKTSESLKLLLKDFEVQMVEEYLKIIKDMTDDYKNSGIRDMSDSEIKNMLIEHNLDRHKMIFNDSLFTGKAKIS